MYIYIYMYVCMYIRKARHVAPAHARNDAPVALFKSSDKRVSRPTRLCLRTPTRFLHTHTHFYVFIYLIIYLYMYIYIVLRATHHHACSLYLRFHVFYHTYHTLTLLFIIIIFFLFEEKNNRYVYHICINTMNGMSKLVAQ